MRRGERQVRGRASLVVAVLVAAIAPAVGAQRAVGATAAE